MYFAGESNVAGAVGNLGGVKNLVYRNEPVQAVPMPYYGGGMGVEMLAGSPSFDINRRPGAVGGRSGEQLKRLYEGGTQQNEKLNEELRQRGIMPRGVDLPFALGLDASPIIAQSYPGAQAVGNLGAFTNQPYSFGFDGKYVS